MDGFKTDEVLLGELGRALARARLDRNKTQQELAREAGVSRATVHRLESGQSTQLTNLVRILRALGLSGNVRYLVPNALVRPLDQLRQERGGAVRERARRKGGDATAKPWTWGES